MLLKRIKTFLRRQFGNKNYKFILKNWRPLFDLSASSQVLETKRFTRNLQTQILEKPEASRILVISPHPDDDIFGAGGTILKAAYAGCEAHSVYITDVGDTPQQNQNIHHEISESCQLIQSHPHFFELPANNIPLSSHPSIDRLIKLIDTIKPECLFISFLLDDHDDHRRVNELLLTIASQLSHKPKEIWAYQIYSTVLPNVVVNITEQVAIKEKAMRLLKSVKGNRDWAHYVLGMNAMNCRFIPSKEPVYGEAFFVVPWQEYLDLCELYFSNGADRVYYNPNYRTKK